MTHNKDGISIGTVSGGIVNFGGAVYIAPISITKTISGSGDENQSEDEITNSLLKYSGKGNVTNLIDFIRRSI